MRTTRIGVVALGLVAVAVATAGWASDKLVWDQSNRALNGVYFITSYVYANDFVVGTSARLNSADVWLSDMTVNDNGTLDQFSGVLGWAVYTDNAGAPDTLLVSGRSAAVQQTDTGVQNTFGEDVVKVHFDLDPPVSLASGTYWFALKENPWGGVSDGSETTWMRASSVVGASPRYAIDETNPGSWITTGANDATFVLYAGAAIWDQSPVEAAAGGVVIGNAVPANDFTLGSSASFSSIDAWLMDYTVDDDGVLNTFSGQLSWAVYADATGAPGSSPLTNGDGQNVRQYDTGLQSNAASDVVRVRMALGRSVALEANTYWLALHEGAWGSGYDGTDILWYFGSAYLGAGIYVDTDETAPGGNWTGPGSDETAFVLFDDMIFASGFEAGGTCGWSASTGGC